MSEQVKLLDFYMFAESVIFILFLFLFIQIFFAYNFELLPRKKRI